MRLRYSFLTFIFFALVFLPAITSAETVVRTGQSITVADDQIVEGDFYGAGETVVVSGQTNGDVVIAAPTATLNGVIDGDALLLAGVSQLHASVTDDVRIVGGEVSIAGPVGGDVFVLGGKLTLLPTAAVTGDVFFFGGEAEINGAVTGNVQGQAERVRINTGVGGNVDVTAVLGLSLGDRASIAGDVRYTSNVDLSRSASAVIEGSITENSVPLEAASSQSAIIAFLSLVFTSLTILLVARKRLERLVSDTYHNFGTRGLLGLGVFLLTPFVGLLLLVTAIGFMLGLILLFGYLLVLLLASALSAIVVGAFINKVFTKKIHVSLLSTIMGAITLSAMTLVPVVGPILVLAFAVVIIGSVTRSCYRLLITE